MRKYHIIHNYTPRMVNFLIAITLVAMVSSCHSDEYKISGNIDGAQEDSYISLEQPDANGGWLVLDSIKLDKKGKFSFYHQAPAAPEIVRLRYDGDYIYIPIDSIDRIEVNAKAIGFGSRFELKGSENARKLQEFEQRLITVRPYLNIPDSADKFKKDVYARYIKDSKASIISYYVLTKTIDGRPLYDAASDYRYFAAVATSYKQYRPRDPHTALLEAVSMEGMKRRNREQGKQRVLHAGETAIVDIALPDVNNQIVTLSSIVGGGVPTVVYFQAAPSETTALLNMKLKTLYSRGGVKIYQVSFSDDPYAWSQSVAGLPWTNVLAGDQSTATEVSISYNLQSLPMFFIYDGSGQLVDRASSYEELESKI